MRKKGMIICLLLCAALTILLVFSACGEEKQNDPSPTSAVGASSSPQVTKTPDRSKETPEQAPTKEPTPAAPTPEVEIVSQDPVAADFFNDAVLAARYAHSVGSSIAIQFYATAPFDSLELTCPSWSDSIGTIVFDLYPWKGSYDGSLGEAAATQEFVDYPDNAVNVMTLEELPAGEYILYLSSPDPTELVGCYLANEIYDSVAVYADDIFMDTVSVAYFTVHYTKTPSVLQGPVTLH